jgi:hypothetical protein
VGMIVFNGENGFFDGSNYNTNVCKLVYVNFGFCIQ